jgi:Holliday junction resolvasome RuvABC endonuclease subunit
MAEPRKPESLYIGIDQSYSGFGLVVLDETGHCYQKSLLKYPLNKFDNEAARLVKIYDDLIMYFALHQGTGAKIHIGMEGYAYGAKLNREKLGELGGIVKLTSHLVFNQNPQTIQPTALKQFIGGSGKATKQQMVEAIQQFDPEIVDDNLADAYGICLMLQSS